MGYEESIRDYFSLDNDESRKQHLLNICNLNEQLATSDLDIIFSFINRILKNNNNKSFERIYVWVILSRVQQAINKQLEGADNSNNNNSNGNNLINSNNSILEYYFMKFLNDDSIIREFDQFIFTTVKNARSLSITVTIFKEVIIPSIDYINKQTLIVYLNLVIFLTKYKQKKQELSSEDPSSQQQQQQQLDYSTLYEQIDIYTNKILEFSKTNGLFEKLYKDGDLDLLVSISTSFFNIYILACLQSNPIPALLNFGNVSKLIVSNYLLPSNKRNCIEYQNILHVVFDTAKSYLYEILSDIKHKRKVSGRTLKIFKFNSNLIQFLISSFSPIFSLEELDYCVKVIMDMSNQLLPNKELRNIEMDGLDFIKSDIQPILEKIIETFINSNSNDIMWLIKFIEVINNSNNSSNSNNTNNTNNNTSDNQNLKVLKTILLIFNNSKFLNNEHFSNEQQLSSVLIQLFKSSIGLLENCYNEIFELPYTQLIIMKSFKSLVLHSSILKNNDFFKQLVSLIYYSNSIIQNILINIWYIIIKNSTEDFQNWNLQFLIKLVLKFNDSYEVSEFLDKISILLKRVFNLLNISQQKIIYKHLVVDVLCNKQNEIQDNSKLIPISIGIFFFIIGNGDLVIDYDLKNDIRSTLVPFLITKLNQEDIYSFPNLMENLLFILSKINYKLKLEDINLINNIGISILNSMVQSKELCKLFENSFIVPNCLEILSSNCDYLSIDQLNKILLVCCSNSISSQPLYKYPLCTLIGRIGQSTICNNNLEKLDQGSVIKYLKSIYQNLFSSASLILYLNIEESLKSFITTTSSPFSTNTTINSNSNSNSNSNNNIGTDIEMNEIKSSQQDKFIKIHLDKIIPKEEMKRIKDFLSSKPQAISTIPLNDTKRYNDEAITIQKSDQLRINNLRERYNVLNCQLINIQSVFTIDKPATTTSPKLISSGLNGNLAVSSIGKLVNTNPPKSFSKDELNYGLELIKEGVSRIKKQIDYGIKMDKDSLDTYRRNFKQAGEQISELYDNLY